MASSFNFAPPEQPQTSSFNFSTPTPDISTQPAASSPYTQPSANPSGFFGNLWAGIQQFAQNTEKGVVGSVQQAGKGVGELFSGKILSGASDTIQGVAGAPFMATPAGAALNTATPLVASEIAKIPAVQKFAMSPAGQDTAGYAQDVSTAANLALIALGGVEGVRSLVKGADMQLAGAKAATEVRNLPIENQTPETTNVPIENTNPSRTLPVTDQTPNATSVKTVSYNQYGEPLDTIQTGSPPDNSLPTIKLPADQTETQAPKGYSYETPPTTVTPPERVAGLSPKTVPMNEMPYAPSKEPITSPVPSETNNGVTGETPITTGSPNVTGETPTISGRGEKIAGSAQAISDSLVQKGMEAIPPEELAKYTSGSYKNSYEQTSILKDTSPEALMEMAKTGKNIPAGVHPQIVMTIAKDLADEQFAKTGDPTPVRELAASPLHSERSTHAGELGSAGFRKTADSGVDYLRKADTAKGGSNAEADIAKATRQAKATISRVAARLIDYEKIIESITC